MDVAGDAFFFADDASVIRRSRIYRSEEETRQSRVATTASISRGLVSVKWWADQWKMEISAKKSQVMLLTRSPYGGPPPIMYGNTALPYVNEMKLLGVHLTPNLSWDTHVDKVLTSANRARSFLWKLKGLLPPEALINFYKTAVRPLVEYCSPLLVGAPAVVLKKLDSFEYRCINIINNYSSRSADFFASEDSLCLRRKVGALAYLSKVLLNKVPLPVRALAPLLAFSGASDRISALTGARLAYDSRRPKYITRCGLNQAICLYNELPLGVRNGLAAIFCRESSGSSIMLCKRLVVDSLRGLPTGTVRPKRKVVAHDPHSERGPPACCGIPSPNNHT